MAEQENLRIAVTERRKALHKLGYELLPVLSRGKRPALNGWTNAATDPAAITAWADTYPNALSTGIRTRYTPAVDIDVRDPGVADRIEQAILGMVSQGVVLGRTGLAPKRLIPFRCATPFKKICTPWFEADGVKHRVEVLADGQQFVAEGIHVDTGKPYSWGDGVHVLNVPQADLAVMDEALARRIVAAASEIMTQSGWAEIGANGAAETGPTDEMRTATAADFDPQYFRTALKNECAELAAMAKGGRNEKLNRAAFGLFQLVAIGGLDENEVRERLFAAAEACGLVAEDGEESVRATIKSGAKAGRAQPRQVSDRTNGHAGEREEDADHEEEKVIPIDLWAKFDPPTLPRDVLPKVIEQFAFEQGELMGADPAGLALAALTVCGAAIPDRVELQVKEHDPSWRESARLWIALVADPSSKKSPILRQAARPLVYLDAELARQYAQEMEAYQQLPADERKATEPPKKRRMRIEDTTIEAAQHILKDSPDGVLSLQDELSGWFGAVEKYASGRGAGKDRGFWLQSWNGGSYVSDRIGRGTVYIPNLSVSLLGGIQPAAMRKVIEDTVDDGLIQRLIPVMLCPATMSRDEERPDAVTEYEAVIARLVGERSYGAEERPPLKVRFSPGAQAIRRRLEQRHLELMTCEGFNAKLAAHLGKYDGYFARLCLIWHCLEADWRSPINEEIALRAERFLHRFLLPHAVAFYASMGGDNLGRLADVAGYILAHNLEIVTSRDLARCVRSTKGLTTFELKEIFDTLDALGWLTPTPGPRPSSPVRWKVNPECHRLFAERAKAERERREKTREMLQELFSKSEEM